ncbi:MAG: hypothetical protein HY784_18915, partial [Chloroflexi bacterium]|nr:hypothetical protein [Chloroflexota bacterium]
NPWQMVADELPAGLLAAERGRDVGRMLAVLRPWLEAYGKAVRRLSLARTSPQLILEIDLPPLTAEGPGPDFFRSLKEMADGVAAARESAGEA